MRYFLYLRVSSDKQDAKSQETELFKYAVKNKISIERIIEETISSRKKMRDRKIFDLANNLKKGDIIITTEVSRIARSMMEVFSLVELIMNKKGGIIFANDNLKFGVASEDSNAEFYSKIVLSTFSVCAELERKLISDRTKYGIENARQKGKKIGRPPGEGKSKIENYLGEIKKFRNIGVSYAKIAEILKIHPNTIYIYFKKNPDAKSFVEGKNESYRDNI